MLSCYIHMSINQISVKKLQVITWFEISNQYKNIFVTIMWLE